MSSGWTPAVTLAESAPIQSMNNLSGTRIFLFNPPGRIFQRGEERSQGNVEDSTSTTLRTPLDLCAMAAVAQRMGASCHIIDFPAESGSWDDYRRILAAIKPQIIVMSVTNATVLDDLHAFHIARDMFPAILCIAKGALFFNPPRDLLNRPEFSCLDYAVGGEPDIVFAALLPAHFAGCPANVPGLSYKASDGIWQSTRFESFEYDLDSLPFPDRSLIRNELYVRPDTGALQTTIWVARGCPHSCTFCLTPVISGKQARHRSPGNICDEIEHCIARHGIRNFFLRADTFTLDEGWVSSLCHEIITRRLNIEWAANSRVAPIVQSETFEIMRRAGCWLVAFGFESGSVRTLRKMKKNAWVEQAVESTRRARAASLKIYGFFLIGMPWETLQDIAATERLASDLHCDFYEVHIAVPYEGTELGIQARELGLIRAPALGKDYFTDPPCGTLHLSSRQLTDIRRGMLRRLHLNSSFLWRKLAGLGSFGELKAYLSFGWKLLRNTSGESKKSPGT